MTNYRTCCKPRTKAPRIYKKVYLTLGGGLGDVIYDYLGGHRFWNKLEPLKIAHPEIRIKVMSSTHNLQSLELIRYNPYIDRMEEYGWQTDGKPIFKRNAGGYINIKNIKQELSKLPSRPPGIYLNQRDKETVSNISSQGSFIFIHPFAGLQDRMPYRSSSQFVPIIDNIIKNTNHNVVIVGSNHIRNNMKKKVDIREEFSYEGDRVFNLVNKPEMNVRVAVKLAQRAHGFLGAWSCFSCTFWALKKKSMVLVPMSKKDKLAKRFKPGGRWHRRGICEAVYIKEDTQISDVINRVLKFYG